MAFFQPTVSGSAQDSPYLRSDPFITGYELTVLDSYRFSLTPGAARAYNSDFVIVHDSEAVSQNPVSVIDIRNVGLLGCYPWSLDQFVFSLNTLFNVYAIADSSGANLPSFVVATGDKFLPSGYDSWRKIGAVYVKQEDKTLIKITQVGSGITRDYYVNRCLESGLYGPTTNFPIPLTSGPTPCNPYFFQAVYMNYAFKPASESDYAWLSPNASVESGISPFIIRSNAVGTTGKLRAGYWIPSSKLVNDHVIYITIVGAGSTCEFNVGGWREEMALSAI